MFPNKTNNYKVFSALFLMAGAFFSGQWLSHPPSVVDADLATEYAKSQSPDQRAKMLKSQGDLIKAEGELEKALKYYTEALSVKDIDPKLEARLYLSAGDTHLAMGAHKEAASSYKKGLAITDGDSRVKGYLHHNLGKVYGVMNQPDLSAESYQKGLDLKHPNPHLETLLKKGKEEATLTNSELGFKAYAEGNMEKAIASFNRSLISEKLDCEDKARTYLFMAKAYKAKEMIQDYKTSLISGIKCGAFESEVELELLYELGSHFLSIGNLDDAINTFNQAATLDLSQSPTHKLVQYGLASALFKCGNYDLAFEMYEKAGPLDQIPPEFLPPPQVKFENPTPKQEAPLKTDWKKEAIDLIESGKCEEGLALYQRAIDEIEDVKRKAVMHYNAGNLLVDCKKNELAKGEFEKALRIKFKGDVIKALIHNNLGLVFKLEGKMDSAISHYKQGLKLAPSTHAVHLSLLYNLGEAQVAKGNLKEALTNFNKGLQLKLPERVLMASIHQQIGSIYLMQESFALATSHFEQGLALGAANVDANFKMKLGLATILQKTGDLPGALEMSQKALADAAFLTELEATAALHKQMGLILFKLGKLQESQAAYSQGLAIEKRSRLETQTTLAENQ